MRLCLERHRHKLMCRLSASMPHACLLPGNDPRCLICKGVCCSNLACAPLLGEPHVPAHVQTLCKYMPHACLLPGNDTRFLVCKEVHYNNLACASLLGGAQAQAPM